MKVLHVISDRNVGGAGILLCNLLKSFPRERVKSVVALPRGSLLAERIDALGVEMIELESPVERPRPGAICELWRVLLRVKPDLLHANAALSARIAASILRLPVLHTRHCCFPASGMQATRIGRWINCLASDLAIATAEAAARDLEALGFSRDRIRCIPNGSHSVRQVKREELAAFQKQAGISETDLCIGICARLELCKGHRCFLLAAQRLRERLPELPLRFLIAGEGSERAALTQLAQSLGILPFVRFLGFVEDPAPFYRTLAVNVNCSVGTETSCLALSEGMSASLPTVASDYGGNPAMLEGDEEVGLLYPSGNAETLALLLEELICDPERRARMGRAAQERFLRQYTADRMAQATLAVYEELLDKKGK